MDFVRCFELPMQHDVSEQIEVKVTEILRKHPTDDCIDIKIFSVKDWIIVTLMFQNGIQ